MPASLDSHRQPRQCSAALTSPAERAPASSSLPRHQVPASNLDFDFLLSVICALFAWLSERDSFAVGSVEYAVEPGTRVKFPKVLRVPGSTSSLALLGTGGFPSISTMLYNFFMAGSLRPPCYTISFSYSICSSRHFPKLFLNLAPNL